jgi:hypothetical protein
VPEAVPDEGLKALPRADDTLQLTAFAVVIVIVAEAFCWIVDGLAKSEPDAPCCTSSLATDSAPVPHEFVARAA